MECFIINIFTAILVTTGKPIQVIKEECFISDIQTKVIYKTTDNKLVNVYTLYHESIIYAEFKRK